MITYRQ